MHLKIQKRKSANDNNKSNSSPDIGNESATQANSNPPSASEQPATNVENNNTDSGRIDGEVVEEDLIPGVLAAVPHAVGENVDHHVPATKKKKVTTTTTRMRQGAA